MIGTFFAGFLLGFAGTFSAAIIAITREKKRKALPPHDSTED